jgi:hypothetical protein
MLYERDKELIRKLQKNAEGKYQQFTQGDVEYLVHTIKKCSRLEDELYEIGLNSLERLINQTEKKDFSIR